MNKSIKIIALVLVLIMGVMAITNISYAAINTAIIDEIGTKAETENNAIDTATGKLVTSAGSIVRLIRNIALIAGVILISVLGVKYMLGSAEEKADYKKSFIPLIIGAVVVMAATQIASMIFSLM